MILLDTHAWIWWVASPAKLSEKAVSAIRKAEAKSEVGVSIMSCWELAMLVQRGRLGFSMDVEEWIEKALQLPEVRLFELTPKIAVYSTRLALKPPPDPVDRILIATANLHNAILVTKDKEIQDYPHVKSIW